MSVTIAMPRMSTDPELTTAQSKYVESLARAGAEVHWVELSDPDAAAAEALTCDGLLLPGGGDMDPAFYGQERIPACGEPNLLRDAAEPKLLRAFLAADKPVLGICRGHSGDERRAGRHAVSGTSSLSSTFPTMITGRKSIPSRCGGGTPAVPPAGGRTPCSSTASTIRRQTALPPN